MLVRFGMTLPLFAAAGDGDGAAVDADATANAPTINADDTEGDPWTKDDDAKPGDAKAADAKPGDAAAADDAKPDAVKVDAKPDDAAADAKKDEPVPREVFLDRIAELSKKNTRTAAENAELRAQLAARDVKAAADGEPAADAAPNRADFKTQSDFDKAVQAEAARQMELAEFNRKCDTVADVGEAAYKDTWNDAITNLRILSDDGNIPLQLLNAALAADDPAKALHELGQNPREAQRIMRLPPVQQIAETIKHGLKSGAAKPAKPRSAAPAPVDPIKGAGGHDDHAGLGDDIDDATWLKNRNAQMRQGARG